MAPRARGGRRLISVVVPCRNEARTLGACLDALQAQDHPDYEVLLVDGGSRDGCRDLARRHGVRTLADGGRGASAARNLGAREARGEVVAFTDADCVPARDWLTRLDAAMTLDVAGVAGAMRMSTRTLLGRMEDADARANYCGFITSNVAYRRDILLSVGGFDERLVSAEDYELAWRVLDAGHRIAREPRAVVMHDPPELSSLRAYLRKQVWYARHDVRSFAVALPRSRRALRPAASAAEGAAWTMLVAAAPLAPRLAAAAGAGALLVAAKRVLATDAPRRELPQMALVGAAKTLARGAGTLLGVGDLLTTPLAPAPARSPQAAAPRTAPWPGAPAA